MQDEIIDISRMQISHQQGAHGHLTNIMQLAPAGTTSQQQILTEIPLGKFQEYSNLIIENILNLRDGWAGQKTNSKQWNA